MNRKVYKTLAKKYGVSVDEIKRDMQTAINHAYQTPSPEAQAIKRKGEIPTVNEFISHVAQDLREDEAADAACKRLDSLIDEPLAQLIMNVLAMSGNTIFHETGSICEFKSKPIAKLKDYHFSIGLYIRNNILKDGSALVEKFKERGIVERDDMSTAIIRAWHKKLRE